MAKTKTGFKFKESDLLAKGYRQNPDGSYSPPALKSAYIKSLKENEANSPSKKEKQYIKEIVSINRDFIIGGKYPITLDIVPIGKPRMTQQDKWLNPPRKAVKLYWGYKENLLKESHLKGFELKECGMHITFVIPMPHSWNHIKKTQMDKTPHQSKPDGDNCLKALQDCLCKSDSHIWDVRITKIWGQYGRIVINEI